MKDRRKSECKTVTDDWPVIRKTIVTIPAETKRKPAGHYSGTGNRGRQSFLYRKTFPSGGKSRLVPVKCRFRTMIIQDISRSGLSLKQRIAKQTFFRYISACRNSRPETARQGGKIHLTDYPTGISVRPTLFYDARLKGISPSGNGDKLIIEYQGREIFLPADSANAQHYEKRLKASGNEAGLIGLARQVRRRTPGNRRAGVFYRFDAYCDQTLRRAFDLDDYEYLDNSYNLNCIGWRNAKNPDGFLAPRGILPGEDGRFVSDNTEKYLFAIPFEFIELATRMKTDPATLLKTFIADTCNLQSTPELPRADGLSGRGTEALRKARDYLRTAWRLKKDFF